jgi:hypothetical protein
MKLCTAILLLSLFFLHEANAQNPEVLSDGETPKDLPWGKQISNAKIALKIENVSQPVAGTNPIAALVYVCNLGNSTISTADSFGELHGLEIFSKNNKGELANVSETVAVSKAGSGPGIISRKTIIIPEGKTAVFHLILSKEILDASNGKIIAGVEFASTNDVFCTVYSLETVLPKSSSPLSATSPTTQQKSP